jgi:alginate O-acetyltransferase complex protein AlgI
MLGYFSIFLYIIILAAIVHHIIPPNWVRLRQISALFFSGVVIVTISPATAVAGWLVFFVVYLYFLLRKWVRIDGLASNLSVLTIIGICSSIKYGWGIESQIETIGISYLMLKALTTVWQIRRQDYTPSHLDFFDVALLFFFLPIFSAGPIEQPKAFMVKNFSKELSLQDVFTGITRILIGVFKAHFLAAIILVELMGHVGSLADATGFTLLILIMIKFLGLYLGFSGYADIAVGAGRLFGLKISENFNFPLASSNIREFWRRWHMTLGRFIREFIFLPLMRRYSKLVGAFKGAAEFCIFTSFVIVGLWHNLSWNYLIWGVCHGGALAAYMRYDAYRKKNKAFKKATTGRGYQVVGAIVTTFYVAVVSVFANSKDISSGLNLLVRLGGG